MTLSTISVDTREANSSGPSEETCPEYSAMAIASRPDSRANAFA